MSKLAAFAESVLSNVAAQIVYVLLAALCLAIWQFARRRLQAGERRASQLDPEPPMSRTASLVLAIPFWLALAGIYGICSMPLLIVPAALVHGAVNAIRGLTDPSIPAWLSAALMLSSFAIALAAIGWRTFRSERPLHRIGRFFLDGVMVAFFGFVWMIVFGVAGSLTGMQNTPPPPQYVAVTAVWGIVGLALFYLAVARIYFTDGLLPRGRSRRPLVVGEDA